MALLPFGSHQAAPGSSKRESSLLTTYWSESTFIIVMIRWTGLAPWEINTLRPTLQVRESLGMHLESCWCRVCVANRTAAAEKVRPEVDYPPRPLMA